MELATLNAEINRRDLLVGAALAGGAAALAGAVQPAAARADEAAEPEHEDVVVKHVASESVTVFGGCTYSMDEPAPIDAATVTWDDEADVVVAGTGGGLAGAARAASLGNSVIALDTASSYGGTSQEACLYYFAMGTRCQNEAGIPDITPDMTAVLLSGYPRGAKYPKHVDANLQAMKDLIAWCEEGGLMWEPGWVDGEWKVAYAAAPVGSQEGWNSYRIMKEVEDFYNKVFTENGGRYMFRTPITGLVMENGAVVGVQATPKETGEPVYIKANKGVILACGGFTNNIAMLKAYAPTAFARAMLNTAGMDDNGDAIRIGLGAGAQLDGWDNCGIFDGGIMNVAWNHHLYAADIQVARQPWLQVDTMGDRVPYNVEDYSAAGAAIAAMPEARVFSFFDANWETYCDKFVLPMCRNLSKPTMPNTERWDGRLDTDYRNGVNQAIEQGRIVSADTPEELAEKLGLQPEKLAAAFKEWNDMVASGDGSEWGYTNPDWLNPLDTPPYYGQALGAMLFSTRCGLSVDENQQVIAKNGALIPGLYAAGQTSGRPHSCVCGDVGYGATSAWIAANAICGA